VSVDACLWASSEATDRGKLSAGCCGDRVDDEGEITWWAYPWPGETAWSAQHARMSHL